MVAAPYDTEVIQESLADFALSHKVSSLSKQVHEVIIYQSKDDTSVSYLDALKYHQDLPDATLLMFEDRGHFIQATFPELIDQIKKQ